MSRILDQNGDGYGPTLQLVEEVGCPAQRKLIFRCSCGGFEGFPHAVVVPQHTRIEGTMDIVLLHQLADTLAAIPPPLYAGDPQHDLGGLLKKYGIVPCFSREAVFSATQVMSSALSWLPQSRVRFDNLIRNLLNLRIDPPESVRESLVNCLNGATVAMMQHTSSSASETLARGIGPPSSDV